MARFFGLNARQPITHLYIQKADLPGLSPLATNTAESLLVALLLRVNQHESNSLISRVVIDIFNQEFIKISNLSVIQSILLINRYLLVTYSINSNPLISNQSNKTTEAIKPNNISN